MTAANSNTSFLSIKDALAVLNIQLSNITLEDIKAAYGRAATKYHPDRNPAGLETMKMVNVAYYILKTQNLSKINSINLKSPSNCDYGEAINRALNAIISLGLNIEICGAWVWVSGNTKPHKDILKIAGFFWSPKKFCWYFRPGGYKSLNHNVWAMNKIRSIYGSTKIKEELKQVAYAQ